MERLAVMLVIKKYLKNMVKVLQSWCCFAGLYPFVDRFLTVARYSKLVSFCQKVSESYVVAPALFFLIQPWIVCTKISKSSSTSAEKYLSSKCSSWNWSIFLLKQFWRGAVIVCRLRSGASVCSKCSLVLILSKCVIVSDSALSSRMLFLLEHLPSRSEKWQPEDWREAVR